MIFLLLCVLLVAKAVEGSNKFIPISIWKGEKAGGGDLKSMFTKPINTETHKLLKSRQLCKINLVDIKNLYETSPPKESKIKYE